MKPDVRWASLFALTFMAFFWGYPEIANPGGLLAPSAPALHHSNVEYGPRLPESAPSLLAQVKAALDGSYLGRYGNTDLCEKLVADINATDKLNSLLSKKLSLQQSKRSAQQPQEPELSGLSPDCANASDSLIENLASVDKAARKKNDDLSRAVADYKPAGTRTDAHK